MENEAEAPGRILRVVLLVPAALLFLSGLAMLIATPLAWGAAADVGQPDWITSFTGLVVAVPAIAVGWVCLREIRQRTKYEFALAPIQVWVGFVFLLFIAVGIVIFAFRIVDPATYESLRPANPRGREVSAFSFLTISLFGTGVTGMFTAGLAFLYCKSIFGEEPSRYDRRSDERDAMGEMIETSETSDGRSGTAPRPVERGGFLAEIGYGLQNYWAWMTSGPKWRLAGGIVGPLLIPAFFFGASVLPSLATSPPPNTSIEFVTGALGPGANASIRAQTTPGALCSVAMTLPSGEKSTSPGLAENKTADDSGSVSWTWVVEQTLGRTGKVTFQVTCNGNERDSFTINLGI